MLDENHRCENNLCWCKEDFPPNQILLKLSFESVRARLNEVIAALESVEASVGCNKKKAASRPQGKTTEVK